MRNNILRSIINVGFALHLSKGELEGVSGDAGETTMKLLLVLCIANAICGLICVLSDWNNIDRNYVRMA